MAESTEQIRRMADERKARVAAAAHPVRVAKSLENTTIIPPNSDLREEKPPYYPSTIKAPAIGGPVKRIPDGQLVPDWED